MEGGCVAVYGTNFACAGKSIEQMLGQNLAAAYDSSRIFQKLMNYFRAQNVSSHDLIFYGLRALCLTALTILVFWFAEYRWKFVSRFLSEKRTPLDLAVFRIALMVDYLEIVSDLPKILHFAALDSALVVPPVGWGPVASWVPRNHLVVETVGVIFIICLVLSLIGLWTRISVLVTVVSAVYLLAILQIFGKINHSHHMVLFGVILCFSPCGDALSVDAYLRKRRGEGIPALAPARRYGAPLQWIMVLMGLIYFFPGIWKVARGGQRWFSAANLHDLIARKLLEFNPPTALQQWTLHHHFVLVLGALFTIIFEVGWIFAVMDRRLRPSLIVSGLLFHSVTNMLMHISFWTLRCCYVALVDWGAVGSFLSPRIRNARAAARAWVEQRGDNWAVATPGRPFTIVATVFLVGMVLTGVTHRVNAWPVGCYPTFDELPGPVPPRVQLEAEAADGKLYHATLSYDPILQEPFGSERYQGMMMAFGCPGAFYSNAKARAYVRMWEAAYHHPDIVSAKIYCDTYNDSVDSPQVVQHKLLGAVDMDTDIAVTR